MQADDEVADCNVAMHGKAVGYKAEEEVKMRWAYREEEEYKEESDAWDDMDVADIKVPEKPKSDAWAGTNIEVPKKAEGDAWDASEVKVPAKAKSNPWDVADTKIPEKPTAQQSPKVSTSTVQ